MIFFLIFSKNNVNPMNKLQTTPKPWIFSLLTFLFIGLVSSCGSEDLPTDLQRSDRCNMGQKATLTLDIPGIGNYVYTESPSTISHATDTEGSGIDAISMYIYWKDAASGDSLAFDVTVENETLASASYNYDNANFNGTVNFYRYTGGTLQDHFTFDDWETTINDFEVFGTSSNGGFTVTRLAFVDAMTSGTFTRVGAGTAHTFTSNYTICPGY